MKSRMRTPINRRTLIRGTGVAMVLPMLEGMLPVGRAATKAKSTWHRERDCPSQHRTMQPLMLPSGRTLRAVATLQSMSFLSIPIPTPGSCESASDANELLPGYHSIPDQLGKPTSHLVDAGYVNIEAITEMQEKENCPVYSSVHREDAHNERKYDFRPPDKSERVTKTITDPTLLAMKDKLASGEGRAIYKKHRSFSQIMMRGSIAAPAPLLCLFLFLFLFGSPTFRNQSGPDSLPDSSL